MPASSQDVKADPPRGLPRALELPLALAGLLVTLPLVALAAFAVRLTSPGPAFFRQTRVGRSGRHFTLWKLRTMRTGAAGGDTGGSTVTVRGDRRITPVGRLLRRAKLDELPQLWNVVRGDLSLVGPRPEVPRWVDEDDRLWRQVLSARPGLTDPVTLRLRNEEQLLAELRERLQLDVDDVYGRHLQPWKLRGYAEYLLRRSVWSDLRCLLATFGAPFGLRLGLSTAPPTVTEILSSRTPYTESDE